MARNDEPQADVQAEASVSDQSNQDARQNWFARIVSTPILAVLFILTISLATFAPGFFSIPPIDRDEPRFAQASKQMMETGDYVDIRFQEGKRHKKPAGIYWMQVAAAKALGMDEKAPIWVYRIPSLIGAVLAGLLTYWVALALASPPAALLAALMMVGSILLGVEARLAKTDAMLLAFILISQGFLARLFMQMHQPANVPTARNGAGQGASGAPRLGTLGWALFWFAMGVAILIKGPIAPMVIGLTALLLAIITRRVTWLAGLHPLKGLLLALLIAAPWYVAITIVTDGAFFAEAVGKDMLAKIARGQESHGAPPGVYFAAFWGTFWPAAPFMALAAPWIWRQRKDPAILFLLCWMVPTWLLFEAFATKLPHYVLPVYPAIAILIARALVNDGLATRGVAAKLIGFLIPLVPIVMATLAPIALYVFDRTIDPIQIAVLAIAAVLGILAYNNLLKQAAKRALLLSLMAATTMYWGVFGLTFPRVSVLWISSGLQQAIAAEKKTCPNPAIVTTGFNEPSMVFLVGTKTHYRPVEQSAAFLASGEACRFAFIEKRFEKRFFAALGANAGNVETTTRVKGLNLNGGHEIDIGVYRWKQTANTAPVKTEPAQKVEPAAPVRPEKGVETQPEPTMPVKPGGPATQTTGEQTGNTGKGDRKTLNAKPVTEITPKPQTTSTEKPVESEGATDGQ